MRIGSGSLRPEIEEGFLAALGMTGFWSGQAGTPRARGSKATRRPQRSSDGAQQSFVPVGDGLGDDGNVGDAGDAKGVDDGAESAEGNGFVGAKIDDVVLDAWLVS